MAKKETKNVTVNAIERIFKECENETNITLADGVVAAVKRTVGLAEVHDIVSGVIDTCFGVDGAYYPELEDFAIRSLVVSAYTNITLPQDVEKQYEFLYATNIYSLIETAINETQIREIKYAIDKGIRAELESNASRISKMVAKCEEMLVALEAAFDGVSAKDIIDVSKSIKDVDQDKIVDKILERMDKKTTPPDNVIELV